MPLAYSHCDGRNWRHLSYNTNIKLIIMKTLVTLLIALGLSASLVSAGGFGKKAPRGLDSQLERITAVLEDEDRDISDAKRAFLEERQQMLTLQLEVRAEVKAAIEALGEDATREEKHEAIKSVRENYKEQFTAFKEARRTARQERAAEREAAEEVEEDVEEVVEG